MSKIRWTKTLQSTESTEITNWTASYDEVDRPPPAVRRLKYTFPGAWDTVGESVICGVKSWVGSFTNKFSLTAERKLFGPYIIWHYPTEGTTRFLEVFTESFPNKELYPSLVMVAPSHGGYAVPLSEELQSELSEFFYVVPTHMVRFPSHDAYFQRANLTDRGIKLTSFVTTEEPLNDRAVLVTMPRPFHRVAYAGDIIRKRDGTDSVIRWAGRRLNYERTDWGAEIWYDPEAHDVYVHHRPIWPAIQPNVSYDPEELEFFYNLYGHSGSRFLGDYVWRLTTAYGLPQSVRVGAIVRTINYPPESIQCSLILREFYGSSYRDTIIATRDLEFLEARYYPQPSLYIYGIAWEESIPSYNGTADSFRFFAKLDINIHEESDCEIDIKKIYGPWHKVPPDTIPCAVSARQWYDCEYVPGVLLRAIPMV